MGTFEMAYQRYAFPVEGDIVATDGPPIPRITSNLQILNDIGLPAR